jgi:hypothetical protein
MPLSEHEQRILANIERRLLEEDPKFAQQVGRSLQSRLIRRIRLAACGFVLGLIILVVGFAQYVALGVAGFVIMLYSLFELVRTKRRRVGLDRGETPRTAPPSKSARADQAASRWWERMSERWRGHWEERGGTAR